MNLPLEPAPRRILPRLPREGHELWGILSCQHLSCQQTRVDPPDPGKGLAGSIYMRPTVGDLYWPGMSMNLYVCVEGLLSGAQISGYGHLA